MKTEGQKMNERTVLRYFFADIFDEQEIKRKQKKKQHPYGTGNTSGSRM